MRLFLFQFALPLALYHSNILVMDKRKNIKKPKANKTCRSLSKKSTEVTVGKLKA